MQPKVLLTPFFLIAATFIGLADTLYLSYFQYLNLIPTCAIGGCEIVLTSVYSKFFGVPLSYIGLVYYTYMFCLAILLAIDPKSIALRLATVVYSGIGFILSLIFIFYIQLTLLGHVCEYCALSAVTTLILFSVSIWHWRSTRA